MTFSKQLYFLDSVTYLTPFINSPSSFYNTSRFDFHRSLKKCRSGHFTGIVFSERFLDHKELPDYIKITIAADLTPVLHISSSLFLKKQSFLLKLSQTSPFGLNISFTHSDDLPLHQIQSFPKSGCFFTFVLTRQSVLNQLPRWVLKNTELYCPYKRFRRDPFLTPRQVYQFLKNQSVPLKPFQGNIYDDQINLDMDLEPVTQPFIRNSLTSGKTIRFSIIIPSYNNKIQLLNTLKNLAHQNYPKDEYEIISIDDGSMDGTLKALSDFINENKQVNMSVIHFPRVIPRQSGDYRFRAGIARNLGAKRAQGLYLAFLDADILTPPHYLNQLEKEHLKADVVQLKRYHLKKSMDINKLFSDPEGLKKNCYIEENDYWGAFYKKGFEGSHPPWKYVCTYGLSLSKRDFMDYGRFNTNFTGYGFEDTDLGYRLHKAKKKLFLSDIHCYHQPPEKNRREHKSFLKRHSQLSKTAKVFFYNHLDPEIYEQLTVYMKQERGLSYFFPGLRKPVFPKHFL
ncbi:MAG: glycosyltransferase family 2 protein [Bdellovibrionales bacterium]|nr:glycosyltransferase family 2 protein [Bdellovibrionales bacterium]